MSVRLTIRMAAPSILISVLLLTLGSLGGGYLLRVQKRTSARVALDVSSISAVEELVFGLYEIRSDFLDGRAGTEPILARSRATEERLAQVEGLMDDEYEKALAGQIREKFDAFVRKLREPPAPEGPANGGRRRPQMEPLLLEVLRPAKDLLAREEALVVESEKLNEEMAGRVAEVLLLLGFCGSAAGLVAGFGIARSVTRSIVELYVPIRAASGKLEEVIGPIDLLPTAGLSNLDTVLRTMADQVETVVDRLQATQREVLRSEQLAALGQLAAGMAHELRNPLTAIKILIDSAIARGPAANLSRRDLGVLQKETARLERSVQTFLEFARPPKLEKRPEDLRPTIQGTLDLVAARADRQHVRLQADFPAAPLVLHADHEQLRQVFVNLLFNALDALPKGGRIQVAARLTPAPRPVAAGLPPVAAGLRTEPPLPTEGVRPAGDRQSDVSTGSGDPRRTTGSGNPRRTAGSGVPRPTAGSGDPRRTTGLGDPRRTADAGANADGVVSENQVTITVTDDGPGLPENLAEKIFEPYVSTRETGLGLGLAICRRIVEAHGGRLTAHDAAGGGAEFTVELPSPGA
jgi:signal transduction histidine kinase